VASRQDWLDAGLAILDEQGGAPALTIEQLTDRLGLTKGSFYHHFKGMGGFKTALLAHFEAQHTTRYIDLVEGGVADPLAKLRHLLDLILAEDNGPDVEVAVRAWALQDPEVRAAQERIDRARVDYVRSIWAEISGDAEEAALIARQLYVTIIGSGQIIPPIPGPDLRRMCELLLRLHGSD
jgi:AcrR family transcriptional regulator